MLISRGKLDSRMVTVFICPAVNEASGDDQYIQGFIAWIAMWGTFFLLLFFAISGCHCLRKMKFKQDSLLYGKNKSDWWPLLRHMSVASSISIGVGLLHYVEGCTMWKAPCCIWYSTRFDRSCIEWVTCKRRIAGDHKQCNVLPSYCLSSSLLKGLGLRRHAWLSLQVGAVSLDRQGPSWHLW